jgi:hypothetical protein
VVVQVRDAATREVVTVPVTADIAADDVRRLVEACTRGLDDWTVAVAEGVTPSPRAGGAGRRHRAARPERGTGGGHRGRGLTGRRRPEENP